MEAKVADQGFWLQAGYVAMVTSYGEADEGKGRRHVLAQPSQLFKEGFLITSNPLRLLKARLKSSRPNLKMSLEYLTVIIIIILVPGPKRPCDKQPCWMAVGRGGENTLV